MDELAKLDGIALSALIARGEMSADEVLNSTISRIERLNPTLNAVVHAHFDLARAQIAACLPAGPVVGVPLLL